MKLFSSGLSEAVVPAGPPDWNRKCCSSSCGPIAVVLDCSKAFDLAKFSILFERLLTDRHVPAIAVRVLAFSYQEQLAWVRLGRGCTSSTFRLRNGTRQGSVASPVFWSVYLDPLFLQLRKDGIGCHMAGLVMEAVGYTDDVI